MAEDPPNIKRYEIAILQMRYEGQLLWQRFSAFVFPHTIFLAYVLSKVAWQQIPGSSPAVFWTGLVGLILCVPWLAVYRRSSGWYTFRIAQAREIEPPTWQLLAGRGEKFSAGECIEVGDHHRMPWIARVLQTEHSGLLMIWMFIVIYAGITIITSPWFPKVSATGAAP